MAKIEIDVAAKVDEARRDLAKLDDSIEGVGVTVKKMGGSLNDVKGSLDGFSGKTANVANIMSGLTDGLGLAQQGLGYLQTAYTETIARAAEWGDSMGDLAQLTGQSVEETSRLAATMELVGIDAGSLGRILKSMTKEGLNLNLKTLLELNDQYNAIQDPIERNTFLFRNFGKSAEDMAEIMGRSREELEKLAAAADKSGKVIGEEAAAQAEKLNTEMKIAQQQIDGVLTRLGGAGIQFGIFSSQTLRDAIRSFGQWSDSISTGTSIYDIFAAGLVTNNPKLIEFAAAFDEVRSKAQNATEEVDASARSVGAWGDRWAGVAREALAQKALTDAKQAAADLRGELDLLNTAIAGPVAKEQQEFYDNQKAVSLSIVETKDQIAELEGKRYLTDEQKAQLDELKKKLDEQNAALETNRNVHEETTARIVFSMLQQQYAADGLSVAEIDALTKIGVGLGIYDQKTADMMTSASQSIKDHGTDAQAILNDLYNKYTELQQAPDIVKNVTVKYQKVGDEDFGGWTPSSGTPDPATPAPADPLDPGLPQSLDGAQSTATTGQSANGVYIAPGAVVVNAGGANAQEVADLVENMLATRLRMYIQAGV